MNLILSVTENWGIGLGGKLLLSIPDDMRHFREETEGGVVVMGRATLQSLPGGKPLKNRVNIVLSSRPDVSTEGVIIARDLSGLFSVLKRYDRDRIFVIGGESVYQALLPYADTVVLTKMFLTLPADRYFTNIDLDPDWNLLEEGGRKTYEGVGYQFLRYKNLKVKAYGS